ncbi:MAG TPA: CHAD domain-containing protein [Pyrinomonadaceae bacterium]|nr:CHAD domain-containing protein [Pyrinomonadaceae bacterium]
MKGKRVSGLDCGAPADQMIQTALHAQLAAICALRRKALDWSDPEGVHDMRVLSRRLRSAISDFEPHLRKPGLPIAKLKTIAKSLGAVRDEDVAIAALEKLKASAHGEVPEGIEVFIEERKLLREGAREALNKAIRRSAVDQVREEFEGRLQNIAVAVKKSSRRNIPQVAPTFGRIGTRVLTARLKEFRAASPHIFFPFENTELHELRILAKRLRYALDLFDCCWGEDIKAAAKEIALLQTSLGELHDCDVWIGDLGTRLRKASSRDQSDRAHEPTNVAATWLLKHFARERTEHYRDALGRWQQWESDGFLKGLTSKIMAPELKTEPPPTH